MLKLDQIRSVQIELTTRCNARCPMCMRNYRGSDFNSGYPETELYLEDIKRFFPVDFLRQLTKGILFNGNLGDFGLARDARDIAHYFADLGLPVSINTNGSMRTTSWWASMAHPNITVGFALDGLEDTHHLYRLDTSFSKVIANARAYIQAGGKAAWRFIPFDHNRHQEEQCRQLAKEMGFVKFENIGEGRDSGPVFDRQGNFTHYLGPRGPEPVDIKPMLVNHLTWFDPKTVRSAKDKEPLDIVCNHKRQEEIYVAANGTVYPCCYLGYYPKTMNHPGNGQLKPLVMKNSLYENSLEECLEWFDSVERTWSLPSISQGRLYRCVETCGRA